jgi:hypothetical protein
MRVDLTAMKNLPSKRASRLRRARSRTSRVRPETASTNLTLVSGARSYWPYSAVVRHLGEKPLPRALCRRPAIDPSMTCSRVSGKRRPAGFRLLEAQSWVSLALAAEAQSDELTPSAGGGVGVFEEGSLGCTEGLRPVTASGSISSNFR